MFYFARVGSDGRVSSCTYRAVAEDGEVQLTSAPADEGPWILDAETRTLQPAPLTMSEKADRAAVPSRRLGVALALRLSSRWTTLSPEKKSWVQDVIESAAQAADQAL